MKAPTQLLKNCWGFIQQTEAMSLAPHATAYDNLSSSKGEG